MYLFTSNSAARSIAPSSPFKPSGEVTARVDDGPDRLPLIERHLRETGLAQTAFGRLVARDPRLVEDMRNGREVGSDIVERIDLYFAGYVRGLATQKREG